LLAAFGSQRERYGSAGEVQAYCGIAPVMERSGKKKWVHCRIACPKFLRQSFHEWAGHSIAHSVWARSYYQQLRRRGKQPHAAVRALAFKWVRLVFRCWKDGVALMRANIWPRSPGAALLWLPLMSPLSGKPCEQLCGYAVGRLWRSIKDIQKIYLTDLLRYLVRDSSRISIERGLFHPLRRQRRSLLEISSTMDRVWLVGSWGEL